MGTKNPGKIEGAKLAFEKYFQDVKMEGVLVDSEVSNQPINQEIFTGARNRVNNLKKYAKENNIKADYYIASEAGITNSLGEWYNINLAYIEDGNGYVSTGISQGFPVPDKYIDKIKLIGLGKVMDEILNENELAKGKGGISFLTKGEVSRIELTKNAFIMALTKYINNDIWR